VLLFSLRKTDKTLAHISTFAFEGVAAVSSAGIQINKTQRPAAILETSLISGWKIMVPGKKKVVVTMRRPGHFYCPPRSPLM
jgi:hypothetical protein